MSTVLKSLAFWNISLKWHKEINVLACVQQNTYERQVFSFPAKRKMMKEENNIKITKLNNKAVSKP